MIKTYTYVVVTGKAGIGNTTISYSGIKALAHQVLKYKFDCVQDMLNEFAMKDWELVTLQHLSASKGFIATFKREIPSHTL